MIALKLLPQAKGVTMIEIIQEEKKQKITLPRNLRQIGSPNGDHRIYVEDFVYTFLHPNSQEKRNDGMKVGILVGRQEEYEGVRYYFVKGSLCVENISFEKGLPQFTGEIWGSIYKDMKNYFDDEDPDKSLQILGWSMEMGGMPPRLTTEIERLHKSNFSEEHTLLLLLDEVEREENFYVYEKGNLRRKEGYYIFYEQNPKMQEYMVQYREKKNPTEVTEVFFDEAAKSYRKKLKIEEEGTKKHFSKLGYAACALLVLSTLVIGVNSIGSYEKMEQLQEAVSLIAGNFTEQDSKKDDEELVVTTVDGDVEPLEESVPASSQQPQEQKEEASQQTNAQPAETQQAAPTEAEQILAQGYYVVQSGDSLESISTKIYGNTSRVAKIKEINNIENADNIIIGQKLLLP